MLNRPYIGRFAPSPTGYLHRGHARTFWMAQERALAAGGTMVLRNDDLDRSRVRPEFVQGMLEDMRWLGLQWIEGPDLGGPHTPYHQSGRIPLYREAFDQLKAAGLVYPCLCTRKDVASALAAPHATDAEPVYPGTCRPEQREERKREDEDSDVATNSLVNWRFRNPNGELLFFEDGYSGEQRAVAGVDFGDFLVWRKDDLPSYQLACVVDDALMGITEVARGADLIPSTFRQLLLYRAFGWNPPAFYHCPLVLDEAGKRLAKRDAATTLRGLREAGLSPEQVRSAI